MVSLWHLQPFERVSSFENHLSSVSINLQQYCNLVVIIDNSFW